LRYACLFTCTRIDVDNKTGAITEVHGTWDPDSRGGSAPDGRRVKGTIHWVSAEHAIKAEARLYDRLFTKVNPLDDKEGSDFKAHINPDSLVVRENCRLEPSLKEAQPGDRIQFERLGYFCVDCKESSPQHLVFNRTIALRDSWAKIEKKSL
jgi:glutaminyl-tRNA synthetase